MHRTSSSTSHPTATSLHANSATAVAGPSSPRSTGGPLLSPRLPPSPILVQPLPSTLALEREGIAHSELELDRQIKQAAREKALAEALQEQKWEIERAQAKEDNGGGGLAVLRNLTSRSKGKANAGAGGAGGPTAAFERPPQAYELYQAIDRKDIDFLMRVRDHAFGLLLQKNAGEFPILYAARIGQSHRDVVILLVGALSRYVNHLEEGDFEKKETKGTLKALRANLKLAIDNALLPGDQPHLLSSFLQVLIMSEGDAWLLKSVYDISLLLRDTSSTSTSASPTSDASKPVHQAEQMVRRFCTKELRGVPGGVGDVEEYIANAALDLVIMGVWSLVAGQVDEKPLPTHTFARDLRTYTALLEAVEECKKAGKWSKVGSRLKGMIGTLTERAGDTKKSVRSRLKDVQEVLDK